MTTDDCLINLPLVLLPIGNNPSTSTLIIVPTRELADQVFKAVEGFTTFCAPDVRFITLTQNGSWTPSSAYCVPTLRTSSLRLQLVLR